MQSIQAAENVGWKLLSP